MSIPLERSLIENKDLGTRRCTRCGRVKPTSVYYHQRSHGRPPAPSPWCKACHRIYWGERRESEAYRKWLADYLSRPETIEKRRKADRKRRDSSRAHRKAYRQTARGRLLHSRRQARVKLRKATDPDRIARLEELIAMYSAEIERMDRERDDP